MTSKLAIGVKHIPFERIMEQPLILRSAVFSPVRRGRPPRRHGVTLIELLVATTLMLLIMGLLIFHVFGPVTGAVTNSRALLEQESNRRVAVFVIEDDLRMATAPAKPSLTPEDGLGFFEIIEGPVGPRISPRDVTFDSLPGPAGITDDTTIGDFDDILMFTVGGVDARFSGRCGGTATNSNEAEIIYFVRGTTLYRRVLLILPREEINSHLRWDDVNTIQRGVGFYDDYDVSVALNNDGYIEANSLQDLTRPERRFAHSPNRTHPLRFPNAPRLSYDDAAGAWNVDPNWMILGLPTLRECSHADWAAGMGLPQVALTYNGGEASNRVDLWMNPHAYDGIEASTGTLMAYRGSRLNEDILMTDVIGFDVKVWDPTAPIFETTLANGETVSVEPGDPGYATLVGGTVVGAGAYVDLGYGVGIGSPDLSVFSDMPNSGSGLRGYPFSIYDTWSTQYENDGLGNDAATNGFDDDGNGLIDDDAERDAFAPYEVPLRGIKITIRYYEPNMMQVRESSIYHSFVPE